MIRGERVTLRPIDADEDAERCFGWVNDLDVTRFLGFEGPLTRHKEHEILARERDPEQDIILAVLTEDGTHIGNCGLHRINLASRKAELGIMLGDKRYWGQGYGTDVVKTLCAFGFVRMNLQRIQLGVFSHNPRAQRCYEKCGFQVEGRFRRSIYKAGEYRDEIRMAILREEFMALFPERVPEGMSET
ncbi:MAG: GNAT family N-acetyltransferase [Armatimonadetes bacterium]|nr:GNAT family N-acetyltransferase [Armatimonadota bacterium]